MNSIRPLLWIASGFSLLAIIWIARRWLTYEPERSVTDNDYLEALHSQTFRSIAEIKENLRRMDSGFSPSDSDIISRLRLLRNCGQVEIQYDFSIEGNRLRFRRIQSEIGTVPLPRIPRVAPNKGWGHAYK